jgi:hypothetical protein
MRSVLSSADWDWLKETCNYAKPKRVADEYSQPRTALARTASIRTLVQTNPKKYLRTLQHRAWAPARLFSINEVISV